MKYFLVITALLICFTIKAEEKQIASPDGKIVVTISDKNGQPSYRISYKDTPFINSSSLGLITNIGDFPGKCLWNTMFSQAELTRLIHCPI